MAEPFLECLLCCVLNFGWHTRQPLLRATHNTMHSTCIPCFSSRHQRACTFQVFCSPVHLGLISALTSRLACIMIHRHGCISHFVISSSLPLFIPTALSAAFVVLIRVFVFPCNGDLLGIWDNIIIPQRQIGRIHLMHCTVKCCGA